VAGWCVAELLKRGYDVRATVRSEAKSEQVRRAVATEVDPADRLGFAIADLTSDDGWADAMAGVDYVLHVASPLGMDHTGDAESLIVPARDGTLRVLRAATAAGVKRVVMTSAANTASPSSYRDASVSDETVWTDANDPTLQPYRRSKTAAEKAAWDFMAGYDGPTTLTTILPGAVFGPVLSPSTLGSVQIIGRMVKGMPGWRSWTCGTWPTCTSGR
jgi:nucleoside-diphosphate-sugar epimerase